MPGLVHILPAVLHLRLARLKAGVQAAILGLELIGIRIDHKYVTLIFVWRRVIIIREGEGVRERERD